MPNCFTCRRPCKISDPRVHVCHECIGKQESSIFDVIPWSPLVEVDIHPEIKTEGFERSFKNARYTVYRREVPSEIGQLVHLSIKRTDRNAVHDWRDLQRIKNELLGPEEEACELYPAESRLMDTANQYHLWCFLGMRAPFGYESQRIVMEEADKAGGKQRPFELRPDDLTTEEEWQEKYKAYKAKQIERTGYRGQFKSILDKAVDTEGYGCQNPFRYTDNRKCETVKPEQPELWCGFCMAQLLKKLAVEGGILSC